MFYASIGILALILHLIINKEALCAKRQPGTPVAESRYRGFLITVLLFYITDILWGFLYELRDQAPVLVYADTWLYFLMMASSVLAWTRYVYTYLDKQTTFRKILRILGWTIYGFIVLALIHNFFIPIIFRFTEDHTYVPKAARYILLAAQVVLYLMTFIHSFIVSIRRNNVEKRHNRAVGLTAIVMAVFIALQSFDAFMPYYAIGCLIGTCIIHIFVVEDDKKEKEVYNEIARNLAEDYEVIYFIDIETGKYSEFSKSDEYESMQVPMIGEDFYKETAANVELYVHPDDRDFAANIYTRDEMCKILSDRKSYSFKYRVIVNGEIRHFRFTIIMANDKKHIIVYEKDIEEEVTAEAHRAERHKYHVTFGQIAESLASNYDAIYYVDAENGNYVSYVTNNIYGQLEANQEGEDFFEESRKNAKLVIHKSDRERVISLLNRDHFLTALENRKLYSFEYRLMLNGKSHYTRLSTRKSSDGSHFIVGVENIDAEIRKEKEHLNALNTEKELARRDELTGTKNKNAYTELERSVQNSIDGETGCVPFALVVCDLNNLKLINDTKGHKAGDEYIQASAKLLYDIFSHSPVFRIGGDEFVVFLKDKDYLAREELIDKLRKQVRQNQTRKEGPVIASGLAVYEPENDKLMSAVLERADNQMYTVKQELKAI